MQIPAEAFEDFLAESITISGGSATVVDCAIAFHSEHEPPGLVWVQHTQIDSETRNSDLRSYLKPSLPNQDRYRFLERAVVISIRDLSGGNVQRAVLARELSSDVDVLIVANPCFGLDFVSVADIRAQIMEQRNRGAAVLLVSEDLDEVLELSDRIAVMSGGKVTYLTEGAGADRTTIGRYMAGH